MEKILSFDSGTTNTKIFTYSLGGSILQSFSIKNQIFFPEPLFAEQNSDDWIYALRKGISQIKSRKEIIGISGSFQGGTFVLLDKNGFPLMPGITWLDNRAKDIARFVVSRYGEDFFYRKTGYVPGGWSCLAILLWLKKYQPECFKKIERISFVADYINHYFTGNFVLDHTNAAITTLYNIKEGTWDEEILEIIGIKKQMLPEIAEAGDVAGTLKEGVSRETGLKSGIPVLVGGHDQYCASFGSGACAKGKVLVSCGTAWVLLATTDRIFFDPLRNFSPGPHVKTGLYGLMSSISNGGVVYDWGTKVFSVRTYNFNRPSSLVVIPELTTASGVIAGISLSTKPDDILQAIIESLCFQVREGLERMEKILSSEEKIKGIVMIGGAASHRCLGQLLADITGRNVFIPEINEAAGYGAMKLFRDINQKFKIRGSYFRCRKGLYVDYSRNFGKYLAYKRTIIGC
jgi:xylulokinase